VPYGWEREVLFFFQTLAILALVVSSVQIGRRSRKTGLFSATSGFCILLVCIALFQITVFHALFFAVDSTSRREILMLGNTFVMTGLVFFIVFIETDQKRSTRPPPSSQASTQSLPNTFPTPSHIGKVRGYRYTILALAILGVFLPLIIFFDDLRFALFFSEIVPAGLTTRQFINQFRDMEMVKHNNAPRRFYVGLIVVGLSNFLPALHLVFGYIIFGITSAAIVVGAFLMLASWAQFPRLVDLRWLLNLDRLLVYDSQGGLPLFTYSFKSAARAPPASPREPAGLKSGVASGALTGIDSLLGEILASDGHIREIDYVDKKVLFYRGQLAIFMLVAAKSSQEYWYRLEMFAISFEKEYADGFDNYKLDPTHLDGAISLMRKYFS